MTCAASRDLLGLAIQMREALGTAPRVTALTGALHVELSEPHVAQMVRLLDRVIFAQQVGRQCDECEADLRAGPPTT